MEIEFKKYNYKNYILSFRLSSKGINGIIGKNKEIIEQALKADYEFEGKILVDGKVLKKEEVNLYKRKIKIIKENDYLDIKTETIYELMEYILKIEKIYPKNKEKKINDSLRIVGLDKSILKRNIATISSSEKKLLTYAISLLSNPEVLIIEEPFRYLDLKNTKKILLILRKIKDQYNKIIIFVSNDINKIYQYTDYITIYDKANKIIQGEIKEVFQNVKKLNEYKVELPELIKFTDTVRTNKNIKIDYHKDIRDLIKDIYKHV